MFKKYRIIYIEHKCDPRHWQLQKLFLGIVWVNVGEASQSANSRANEMLMLMGK